MQIRSDFMENVMLQEVVDIVRTCVGNKEITICQVDEDLDKLGVDSLMFMQIIISLENKYECEVPENKLTLYKLDTIRKLYEVIKNEC